jgi:hypothetical protein
MSLEEGGSVFSFLFYFLFREQALGRVEGSLGEGGLAARRHVTEGAPAASTGEGNKQGWIFFFSFLSLSF